MSTTQTEEQAVKNLELLVSSLDGIKTVLQHLTSTVADLQEIVRNQEERIRRLDHNCSRAMADHVESYHASEA